MLGLCEQIGRHPRGVCFAVSDDEDFARTGQKIDRHTSEKLPLGFDHVAVARTENFRHRPDRFGSAGQCSHGLCPADFVDFRRTGQMQGGKECLVHFAVAIRGGDRDDFRHARGGRIGAGHQRGGNERRRSARHVDADAMEWIEPLADLGAMRVPRRPILAQAAPRESADVFVRGRQRPLGRCIERSPGCGQFFRGNAQFFCGECGSTECFGIANQGCIALALHRRDDVAHRFFHGRSGACPAVEGTDESRVVFVAWTDDAHDGEHAREPARSQHRQQRPKPNGNRRGRRERRAF